MNPKIPDPTRMEAFIKGLNEDELRHLNGLIVERLKLISQEKSTRSPARFTIGEMERFSGVAAES